MKGLEHAETAEGFVVYLVSCLLMVCLIWGFHTWDIRKIRQAVSKAMAADLEFAQKCGRQYLPSVYSVWLASELQWRHRRRREDLWRYPAYLAVVTFVLNGLAAMAEVFF